MHIKELHKREAQITQSVRHEPVKPGVRNECVVDGWKRFRVMTDWVVDAMVKLVVRI